MKIIGVTGVDDALNSMVCMHFVDAHEFGDYSFDEPARRGLMEMLELDDECLLNGCWDKPVEGLGVSPSFLQERLMGRWGREVIGEDFWVRFARRWLARVPRYWPGVVFSAVTHESEARFVRECGVLLHAIPTISNKQPMDVKTGDVVIRHEGTTDELFVRLDDVLRG